MKKKVILILSLFCIIALAGVGGYAYSRKLDAERREAAHQEALEKLSIDFREENTVIEYGTSFDVMSLFYSSSGPVTAESEVDTAKLGPSSVSFKVTDKDAYDVPVEKIFETKVTVEDTHAPEITLKEPEISITEGDDFNAEEYLESVKDPVDGDLAKADNLTQGSYTIASDVDPDTPGEYSVTYQAMDIHDLTSKAVLKVTVKEKPKPAAAGGNSSSYRIRVNRALNTVTVYALQSDGSYAPYTAFVCSTGSATPSGTYHTFDKGRWRTLFGPCYGQYVTDIVGNILFHSVPYFTPNMNDLEYDEYNKLGTAASMGCIRLAVRDALWIYSNCGIGTEVEIYDDWNSPGPLGKPGSIHIDTNDERRGWDPTDPDPSNPWN